MPRPYLRKDGILLRPGMWLKTTNGVGKFRGVWRNPTAGEIGMLDLYRAFKAPAIRDTLLFDAGKPSNCILETVEIVGGPLSPKGKGPPARPTAQILAFPGTASDR